MVDGVFHDSIDNFLNFDSRNRQLCAIRGFRKGTFHDDLRDQVAADFMASRADYLMFVDTDIEFDPQQIYELVDEAEAHNRQVLAGLYFGFLANCLMPVWFSELLPDGEYRVFTGFDGVDSVVPLKACGMGFTLIRRDVFERIGSDHPFGRDHHILGDFYSEHGEDLCFCRRAINAGCSIWGHKGVAVGHWKKIRIDVRLFMVLTAWAQSQGQECWKGLFPA